ncbi:MAG: HAD-IA family hydrolase [Gammaproteobacteria bacterium]|nr:HAD-IA family hydrolase [Gammaproteobacteria bacterium]NVK86953.1 HAD-IA family hydrolase [Gammaproteobacteria bacterium]
MNRPEAVLFDLDGTLADTARDLAFALNEVLQSQGHAPLPFDAIRPWVSKGAPGLIKLGFKISPDASDYEPLRQRLLTVYERNICRQTSLFEPLTECLSWFQEQHIPWGIITNKPGYLTTQLLPKLNLDYPPKVVYSGDTFAVKKPHPEPLLNAAKALQIAPEKCWYVGDDRRDMEAARGANMVAVAALWGYIPDNEDSRLWPSDLAYGTPDAFYQALRQL